MQPALTRFTAAVAATLMSLTTTQALAQESASDAAQAPVVVASKIDTEGSVLGQLILQRLAAGDIPVEDRLQLGVTSIVICIRNIPATAPSSST
jgi:osmoprotectant transport system substrate-binding protein